VVTLRNEGSRDGVGFALKDPESVRAHVTYIAPPDAC
jgi:hypothetical protein